MPTTAYECYRHAPDELLVRLIQQKDGAAFAVLHNRHAAAVSHLLRRILRNAEAAEEARQETFWQVWQKAEQYAGKGPVVAWLLRIARNRAVDELRRRNAQSPTCRGDLERLALVLPYPGLRPEAQVEASWAHQDIRRALVRLPADQRHCLELIYFEGLSQREVAERTHTPLGTIKTRVRSGLEKIERFLRSAGYAEGDGVVSERTC
jgi:RNA polymerase sigma-70 factor (ECF subfamily)